LADRKPLLKTIQSNLIAGVLTIMPILIVIWIVSFLVALLSSAGAPVASALTNFIDVQFPIMAPVLANSFVQGTLAVAFVLFVLYLVGAVASRVLGRRLIDFFERLINRIPLIHTVYKAAKQLVGVMQQQPGGAARVVLIDFPHQGAKAIGLVMRTLIDPNTGEEVAAVYVPTAPNPTSGYLQLVPVSKLVPSEMTMDQAMTMIVSGGAVTPERISLTGTLGKPKA
jgi:uncharacterized membrane protein